MRPGGALFLAAFLVAVGLVTACAAPATPAAPTLKVVAIESFLADIAQNVAGERTQVVALIPPGTDPHAFQATPQDIRTLASSDVLIVNGAGLEENLDALLENAGGTHRIIVASAGLVSRVPQADEPQDEHNTMDPHFWFDPTKVETYVVNIRDGLTLADPPGAETYRRNADTYITGLRALDARLAAQVSVLPAARRKLVTDHDTFGYFADRYGFEIVGMIVPSFTTADSTTAQGLAALIDTLRATGARAIFLEAGANPDVAEQIARETGAQVITGLYTHSLSEPDGPAPTYIRMLEYDMQKIVDALK
jgi:ABC-type Zn uptake system ZnuABC Zn-binding protein ZnuA